MHVLGSRKRQPYCTGSQTPFRARDARPVPGTDNPSVNSWAVDKVIPFSDFSDDSIPVAAVWPEVCSSQLFTGLLLRVSPGTRV